eukprot:m.181269 g.181269  ORF g.181269 m.181269 type:complete len:55 (-) comp32056_c0_seq8:38-202(-)
MFVWQSGRQGFENAIGVTSDQSWIPSGDAYEQTRGANNTIAVSIVAITSSRGSP